MARRKHASCDFRGVLRGRDLARAFADMDLFVFPSRTDTFGNVIQEAAASGVASVVTAAGGPRNLVVRGVTGYVADSDPQFIAKVVELASDLDRLRRLEQTQDPLWLRPSGGQRTRTARSQNRRRQNPRLFYPSRFRSPRHRQQNPRSLRIGRPRRRLFPLRNGSHAHGRPALPRPRLSSPRTNRSTSPQRPHPACPPHGQIRPVGASFPGHSKVHGFSRHPG